MPATSPSRRCSGFPTIPKGQALLHVAAPGEDPADVSRLLRNLRRFGRNPVLAVYPPGTGTDLWSKSSWKALLRNANANRPHAGHDPDWQRDGRAPSSARTGWQGPASRRQRHRAGRWLGAIRGGHWMRPSPRRYSSALPRRIWTVRSSWSPATRRPSDVAALVAPRRLTFYGQMPAAFGRTRQIYEGLGVGDRLSVSMSVGAALNQQFGHSFSIGQ